MFLKLVMNNSKIIHLCLLLLSFSFITFKTDGSIISHISSDNYYQQNGRNYSSAMLNLENLLNHLIKALEFFENNFKSINVDGLFGIRISEVMVF